MTTAARSRDWARKQGWTAEVTEHRRGKFRHDLLGLFDALILKEGGVVGVQAFVDGKAERESHAATFKTKSVMVEAWRRAGGTIEFHRWKKLRKRWTVRVEAV